MRRQQRLGTGVLTAALFAACLALPACHENQAEPRKPADLQVIAHGQKVELTEHLAAGKYTVVDFYAAWCPPCRVLGPALERLASKEGDRLAIRKVDVVDWTMPVVDQYGIESLPHLMLYAPDGKRVANGDEVYKVLGDVFGDAAKEVLEAGGAIGNGDVPPTDEQGHEAL